MPATASSMTRLRAFFGPLGGGAVDLTTSQSEEWTVNEISISAGGRPDSARLTRALTGQIVDRVALFQRRQVQVWIIDENQTEFTADWFVTPLFWGEVLNNSFSITARPTDSERAVAMIHRYHFGSVLEGAEVYDPNEQDTLIVSGDVVFNPLGPDLRIDGNMALRQTETGFPTDYNLWLHPESSRSDDAASVHEQTEGNEWKLSLIVDTLQRLLNPDEEYISHDQISTNDTASVEPMPFDNAETPKNVALKRGLYLNECLDKILPPHGLGWYVLLAREESPDITIDRRLAYFQRGQGTEQTIKLQEIGSDLDPDLTELAETTITYDLSNLKTQVIVVAEKTEREVTIELSKGWPEDEDSLTVSNIDLETKAYRYWSANEDGSLDGLRPEITAHLDLDSVFGAGNWVPRRRSMSEPLTYRGGAPNEKEGLRRPILVEWTDDPGYGATWRDIKDNTPGDGLVANWSPLPDQIGIWFNDSELPTFLVDEDIRIRVTCTIASDVAARVQKDVDEAEQPTSAVIPLLIDASDRFFDRARQASGDYASQLTGDHDAQDNTLLIDVFAEAVLEQEFAASVSAQPILLRGIQTRFTIGDVITGIDGRNIDFNRTADGTDPRYPQVTAIRYLQQGARQATLLTLTPYDAPPPPTRSLRTLSGGRV